MANISDSDGTSSDDSTTTYSGLSADELDPNGTKKGILALLAGAVGTQVSTLKSLLSNPSGFIQNEIENWILNEILNPIASAIFNSAAYVADTLLLIAFGADRRPFLLLQVGLLDIPLYIADLIVGAIAPVGIEFVDALQAANTQVAAFGAFLGPFAPILLPLIWLLELAAIITLAWFIIRAIDVPFINLGPIASAFTAPVRAFWRWLR